VRFSTIAFFVLTVVSAPAQQLSADQLLSRAIAEQEKGDLQAAIRDYREVLKLRPEAAGAKVNLGAALARVGQFDEAIALYESALPSLSFKNPVLLNLGLAYYKKGDFANARKQFWTLHNMQPADVRVATLLGDTDLRLGKPQDAADLLLPLEARNSQNLDFQYVLGSALIRVGRRREGVAHIEKEAAGNNNADSYLLAGATLLDMNEFESARRDLEAALRLNPKLPNIYTLVGKVRDKTGDTAQAETAFREALRVNADDFEANLYLGAILYKQRENDEARTYLDRALKLRPSDSMAQYESAMLESNEGRFEAAAQQLEQVIKKDPQWLEPHVALATLYYKIHRPDDGAREREVVERLTAEQQARGPR